MRVQTLILVVLLTYFQVTGQDRQTEIKFFKERNKIKVNRISEITERVFRTWRKPCLKDSAEISFNYRFDDNGNLIQTNEYHRKEPYRTINYTRNQKGDYTSKTYIAYDSLGNVRWTNTWEFEYNKKGQRIKETWKSGEKAIRINQITYDKKGNYNGQLTDSLYQWTFEYDKKRNVIESHEWRNINDTLVCITVTKYKYERGLLISETTQSHKSLEIMNDFVYKYDSADNLILITEKRTNWTRKDNETMKSVIREHITIIENDNKGNVLTKSLYSNTDTNPYRCYYYDYKFRKN